MKHRGPWLVALLAGMASAAALGNVPPTMVDRDAATVEGTAVRVELRAQDLDIDPSNPAAHPLRFVLLQGPSHGLLLGDLADVRYEDPCDAVVTLTYAPAAAFLGTDVLTVAVFDPFDETSMAAIRIDVVERRSVGLASGNWSMDTTWSAQSGSFSAWRTQLTEVYRVGGLTTKAVAQLRTGLVGGVERVVFDALRFEGDIRIGTLSLASTLAFDPKAPSTGLFDYWSASARFAVAGVGFRHTFYLTQPASASYQVCVAEAYLGGVRLVNTLRLELDAACSFRFARDEAALSWAWCDLDMTAGFSVTCAGFEEATFSLSGLALSWAMPGAALKTALRLAGDEKQLSLTLVWKPVASGCVLLFGGLETGGGVKTPLSIDWLSIHGIRLECGIGDVKLVSATSLDPSKNSRITGQTDYWEVIRMSGPLEGCCGVPGTWRVATYFYGDSTVLFGWGMATGGFEARLGEHVTARIELVFRSGELGDPTSEISSGFVVRW